MNKAIRLTKSFTALLLTAIITLGTFAVTANAAELKVWTPQNRQSLTQPSCIIFILICLIKTPISRLPATSSVGTSTVQDMEQM